MRKIGVVAVAALALCAGAAAQEGRPNLRPAFADRAAGLVEELSLGPGPYNQGRHDHEFELGVLKQAAKPGFDAMTEQGEAEYGVYVALLGMHADTLGWRPPSRACLADVEAALRARSWGGRPKSCGK